MLILFMSRQLLDAEFARLGVRTVNGVDMALRWRLMACFGVGWPVCIDTDGTIM